MMKISSADLMTQTGGLYKSDLVYNFLKELDVDSTKTMMVLDFIKDYANVLELSRKSDQDYYEEKIDHLERICDESASRLREVASLLEQEEE